MLDVKKLLAKMLGDLSSIFRGATSTRTDYGTASSITPTKNGWLVAAATSNSSTGAPPVIRIQIGNSIIGEGVGIVGTGNLLLCGAPVRAGTTYTINRYRCNASSAILYH